MPLRLAQLAEHLTGTLASVYLVTGDEHLLVQEACDDVIAAARGQGFGEREVHDIDKGSAWPELLADTSSMSLFADRRLLDVRATPKCFDRVGSEALRGYFEAPADDVLLLVRTGRLETRQRSSAWFKAFDATGIALVIWPIEVAELPRWLGGRCKREGLDLQSDALDYLVHRVEGNLLAAVQEIEKLKLLDLPQPVSLQALEDAVQDASHFDAFDLMDASLAGQQRRVRRILAVLRQEGVQPLAVHGAYLSQVRQLIEGPRRGLPPQRQRLFRDAARRLSRVELETLLTDSAIVDERVKGMRDGDPWRALETLALRLAGASLGHLGRSGFRPRT